LKIPLIAGHAGVKVPFKLDPSNPLTMGPLALQDYYFEFKRQQEEAMREALSVIQLIHEEFGRVSGRKYGNGLVDKYRLEGADIAAVCVGSTAGTTKAVVDELRGEGIKAGLLRLRTFRPLPVNEIAKALRNVKVIAVMDRSNSFGGYGGPIFHEVRHSLYDVENSPHIVNYIYGLGGRDTPQSTIRSIYKDLQTVLKTGKVKDYVRFAGVRE